MEWWWREPSDGPLSVSFDIPSVHPIPSHPSRPELLPSSLSLSVFLTLAHSLSLSLPPKSSQEPPEIPPTSLCPDLASPRPGFSGWSDSSPTPVPRPLRTLRHVTATPNPHRSLPPPHTHKRPHKTRLRWKTSRKSPQAHLSGGPPPIKTLEIHSACYWEPAGSVHPRFCGGGSVLAAALRLLDTEYSIFNTLDTLGIYGSPSFAPLSLSLSLSLLWMLGVRCRATLQL